MAVYYVGPDGNNANDGLSWANRKLTLNGAEDIPVAAGDTVIVGPGVYREILTVDVSGSAGNAIEYRGDYTGAATDSTGGVVRITGSDNDQTATRANCITASAKNFRSFSGFAFDTTSASSIVATNCTNWTVDGVYFGQTLGAGNAIDCNGASQAAWLVTNCYFSMGRLGFVIYFNHSAAVDNSGHVVENCIIAHGSQLVYPLRVGGVAVRNSLLAFSSSDGVLANALTAGQTTTVTNCRIVGCSVGLRAINAGEITENYNNVIGCTIARTNVSVGANSTAYTELYDTRWFFEAVNGGKLVTPFDLASYSQLVNAAGTSPPTADMRGTTVIGAQREWGPLEYDPALLIEAGSGGGGGGRRRRLWMFGG
jgi:hypothetical protein